MMKTNAGEHGRLLEDIRRDATNEAARIRQKTEKEIAERARQYERQLAEITTETAKASATQVASLKKIFEAARAVELRRISLQARDQIFKRIVTRVEEKFHELIGRKNYPDVLLGWIVEAAIGLGCDDVVVNASPPELKQIDDALIKKARDLVKRLVHREIVIDKSTEAPLLGQGIILSSRDGRTAFNNQVRTRVMRNSSAIRKIIYDRLLEDAGGEV